MKPNKGILKNVTQKDAEKEYKEHNLKWENIILSIED
jgi:hypothetical protein